ncbi:hypothetical protein MNB_SV-13-1430 [hydrothermal vent metagenome]|uniref:Uncharacterized protein n=1 Tax=hydrothermal vent metagenome TaxID=652676 RepID=A0A1W1D006_9ZZZZ
MTDLIVKNCIRIKQNDLYLYVFTLNAGEIYTNKEDGYQRIIKEEKVNKIVSYLKGKSKDS